MPSPRQRFVLVQGDPVSAEGKGSSDQLQIKAAFFSEKLLLGFLALLGELIWSCKDPVCSLRVAAT